MAVQDYQRRLQEQLHQFSSFWFLFKVLEMKKSDDVPDRHEHDYWRPPQRLGSNIRRNIGDHRHHAFQTIPGGTTIISNDTLIDYIQQGRVEEYKVASVYFDDTTNQFWCAGLDATQYAVGDVDQNDTDDSSENEEEEEEDTGAGPLDWRRLGFSWQENFTADGHLNPNIPNTGLSSVVFPAEHWTVFMTRGDQAWPSRLLPHTHLNPNAEADDVLPPLGTLNGSLPLLLALIAHTALPNGSNVTNAFLECVQSDGHPWKDPPEPQRRGGRGVVIYVYIPRDCSELAHRFENSWIFF